MTTSTTKILEEINERNLPKYPLKDDLNVELVNLTPVVAEDANTLLTIQAKPGRSYVGDVQIRYTRLALADIMADADVRSTEPFTQQSVIDLINSQFGLFLTLDDLEPFTPPTLSLGETQTLTLQAKSTSRGFIGSVDVEFMYGKTLLQSVIGIRVLPVLNHPIPTSPAVRSARMATWGIDFTSLRDAIRPKAVGGLYLDWAKLQAACVYLNIPSWTQAPTVDLPTSEVEDSNPAFDRVVIQRNVRSIGMVGDVYLHYNTFDEV